VQDVAGQPQQMTDGTLRTPGMVDFFRMLNEQVTAAAANMMCSCSFTVVCLVGQGSVPRALVACWNEPASML
jgi:hypothetical protein